MWNNIFFLGSLIASCAQGWMLGFYITGLEHEAINYIFATLIMFALPMLYLMLGSTWLLIKAEGELFDKAVGWGRAAFWPMVIGFGIISVTTPVVSASIAAKWFTLPNFFLLLPIPVASLATLVVIHRLLADRDSVEAKAWNLFAALTLVCLLAMAGLAYSIFPEIVIGQMTIWESAAPTATLVIMLVGIVITLPLIITYTVMVHRIFKGKATNLSYD